jgi:SNF2 family DNA or RNA helicase
LTVFAVDTKRKLIAVKRDALREGVPEIAVGERDNRVFFHHDDVSTLYLRGAEKLDIPYPLHSYYDWPCPPGWTPDKHQMELFTPHMAYHHRCFVWGDMGTAKTAATLWAIDWAAKHQNVKNVAILATKSTIDGAWLNDINRFMPGRFDVSVLGVGKKHKTEMGHKDHSMLITTHDSLRSVLYTNEELVKMRKKKMERDPMKDVWEAKFRELDMIVVDEHTYYRTHSAARTQILNRITRDNPKIRLIMLSGNPMPNKPTDIYSPAKMVCPDRVPTYFTSFKDMVMTQLSEYKWIAKKDAPTTVFSMIGDLAVRVDSKDVLDTPLPKKKSKKVGVSDVQKKLSYELVKEAAVLLESGEQIRAVNAGVLNNKLVQIYSGAVKTIKIDEKTGIKTEQWRRIPCKKYKALREIRTKFEGPILVYAPFKANIRYLSRWAKERGFTYATITGDTSRGKRKAAFDAVQNNEVDFLFAVPDAMAHGVTLTRSNVVVWWSPLPTKNNDIYSQANKRHDRRGQKRTPYVLHLLANKEEALVLDGVRQKQKPQAVFLNILRERDLTHVTS